MLIDGEKWACEACVRGHRVSNCQHSDRPLQHINKKGRPVSQCHHCRSLRKSRATHVKCDCGEKTHKCVHLQAPVDGHNDSCCCNHGGRCTCSHKKEHPQLDPVPESDSEDEAVVSRSNRGSSVLQRNRARANTGSSEAMLSFDEYGHHKPTKHNKSAHMCGPYQLSRVNSLQSNCSSVGNRSVDDLLHTGRKTSGVSRSSNSPVGYGGPVQDQRKTRSEAASPLLPGVSSLSQLNGRLPPLDLSRIECPPYVPNSAEFFGSYSEHEQPMFSAGLSASSVDWSHYDGLDFASGARADSAVDFAPSSYSQPQSNGFDFSGSEQMHTLTTNTSTSGELSEVDDLLPSSLEEYDIEAAAACGGNGGVFRHSTASSGFDMAAAQMNLLGGADLTALEYGELLAKNLSRGSGEDGIANKSATMANLAGVEVSTLVNATGMPMGLGVFSGVDDPSAFWMDTFAHGLPSIGVDDIPDPDPTLGSFWEPR